MFKVWFKLWKVQITNCRFWKNACHCKSLQFFVKTSSQRFWVETRHDSWHTVWKCSNFPVTLDFTWIRLKADFRTPKTVISTNFAALNFEFLGLFWHFYHVWNYQKIQIKTFKIVKKDHFWPYKMFLQNLVSH